MERTVTRTEALIGHPNLPADKSISHRVAMLAAVAEGTSEIVGYSGAEDPQSTLACLRALGVEMETRDDALFIEGRGLRGLRAPDGPLDCGNSGTTMRLLAGLLAGQPFSSTLIGDASLTSRPMQRIASPLREMGARVRLDEGHAPLTLHGRTLSPITYHLPVASAQVKSCVLLAGLYAEGTTTVVETLPSRDHTERLLGLDALHFGDERHVTIEGGHPIPARLWVVPRDFSAAAFFLVAGLIVPHSELRLLGVGLNPTRAALLDVLRAMGGDITVENERIHGDEPLADLTVRASDLHSVEIGREHTPILMDEVPALCVAAACAQGRTVIRDAAELRVKETDRIDAMATNLRALGVSVETFPDGLAIHGGHALQGATVDSFHDHRIAMAMAVAGLVAAGETTIRGAEHVRISFPDFWDELDAIRGL